MTPVATGPVGGEVVAMRPEEFRRVAALIHSLAGISLPDSKMTLVRARLTRRLRALGIADFRDYVELVEANDAAAAAERQQLISAITTNVTRFFREPHHFEALRTRILPPLIAQARKGGRVRLWSAGCSTGEEPYSIALTVLEAFPEAGRYDIRILASDLDRKVLATAAQGVYASAAIQSIPMALRRLHLVASAGDTHTVGPAPRALVRFRHLNLTQPLPMKGCFDVIFCRNVVIYFDGPTEERVWSRFAERLNPGGWLFVGHSERVNTHALPMFTSDGIASYRRR